MVGYIAWGFFGVLAILQATRVCKIKNSIALIFLFILGPFGFLYCYFLGEPSEVEDNKNEKGIKDKVLITDITRNIQEGERPDSLKKSQENT